MKELCQRQEEKPKMIKKKKYKKISHLIKKLLVSRVIGRKENIRKVVKKINSKVAKDLSLNYSTAKTILFVCRKAKIQVDLEKVRERIPKCTIREINYPTHPIPVISSIGAKNVSADEIYLPFIS